MGKRIPLETRFWRKVREDGECWVWVGATNKDNGYGRVRVDETTKYAHRTAYELMVGPIPTGLQLDHLCRNRACVNPDHLEPVTSAENTRRSPITHGAKRDCPQGHPYTGENLRVWVDSRGYTHRYCRTCHTERRRAFNAAKRASRAA